MKAFNEFWKSQPDFECINKYIECSKCKRDSKIIWKAALEWVLSLNTDKEHIKCGDGTIIEDVRSRFHILKSKIIKEVDSE